MHSSDKWNRLLSFVILIVCRAIAVFGNPRFNTDTNLTLTQKSALAAEISRINLNKTVNPCNDFYEYTCGSSINYGDFLHHSKEHPQDIISRFFSSDITLTNAELKAKDFLWSCQNKGHISQLRQLDLYDAVGGWPFVDSRWLERNFNLASALAEFRKLGVSIFIDLSITTLYNQKVLFVRPSKKHHPFQEKENKIFYQTLINATSANYPDAYRTVNEIRDFTNQRNVLEVESYNSLPDVITYKELKEFINFDWDHYLDVFLGRPLEDKNKVLLQGKGELSHLLSLASSYDKRIMANLLWTTFLIEMHKECHELLKEYFPTMFAKLVHCPPFNENEMLNMLQQFEYAHEKVIKNGRWTTPETYRYVSEMFKAISDWTRYISAKVEQEFSNLYLDRNNFYRNIVVSGLHKTQEDTSELYRVMNLYQAPTLSLVDYYQFLDASSYDQTLPMSMNYARLGTIFGFYAIKPRNHSIDWESSDEHKNEYRQLRTCLSRQIHFPQRVHVSDGSRDALFAKRGGDPMHWTVILNGALKLALESYDHWLRDNTGVSTEENVMLRDYQLNNRRLFFLAHASIFCSAGKYLANSINAELMNMPEFAETFQCAEGMRMNPTVKCRIW